MDNSFEIIVTSIKKEMTKFIPGITTWERLDGARAR
jgi:hypothetical protein